MAAYYLLPMLLIPILVMWWEIGKLKNKILKLEHKVFTERNSAVRWFRSWLSNKNKEAYNKLPSYKEMLESEKLITEENYYPEQV